MPQFFAQSETGGTSKEQGPEAAAQSERVSVLILADEEVDRTMRASPTTQAIAAAVLAENPNLRKDDLGLAA